MVRIIQNSKGKINIIGAALAYIFILIQIKYFLIDKNASLLDSFILGFTTYGIFDFTNLAVFKNYNIYIGISDTIWGGLLYTLVLFTYNIIAK